MRTRQDRDTAEFVELYDGGIGNTPLDGLVVVFFDGGDRLRRKPVVRGVRSRRLQHRRERLLHHGESRGRRAPA